MPDETERLKLTHERKIKQLTEAHAIEMKRTTKKLNRELQKKEEELTRYKRLYQIEKDKNEKLLYKIQSHGLRRRKRNEDGTLTKRTKSDLSRFNPNSEDVDLEPESNESI